MTTDATTSSALPRFRAPLTPGRQLAAIAAMIPKSVASELAELDPWVRFYARILDRLFADTTGPRAGAGAATAGEDEIPRVDHIACTRAEVRVIHRFSEREMAVIDPLLLAIPARMRLHPDFELFEGEEIVPSWVSREARRLPSVLPSIGDHAEGGYLMHMANDARQQAHVHGLLQDDGTFASGTGARLLMGMFGAQRSTIRTAHGIHRIPRGALALIHFPQPESGPTAHQFWNEDEAPGVGNVLFSFHRHDVERGGPAVAGPEMMGKRTYHLDEQAFATAPGHCFVTEPLQ